MLAFEPSSSGRFWSGMQSGVQLGVWARHAWAGALPEADGALRTLVSHEAAHNYMAPVFANDASGALRPGGRLAIADFPLISPAWQSVEIPEWLEAAGFRMLSFEDITGAAIRACEADTARGKRVAILSRPASA